MARTGCAALDQPSSHSSGHKRSKTEPAVDLEALQYIRILLRPKYHIHLKSAPPKHVLVYTYLRVQRN